MIDAPGYDAETERRLAARDAVMPAMLARLDWPVDEIRAERTRALRRLLTMAAERSPWHRARLRGIDPAAADEAALRTIAPMTKADLMANFDQLVTDRALTLEAANDWVEHLPDEPLLGRYWAVASGGSSGLRGVFVYDELAFITFSCMIGRWMARFGPPIPPPGAGPIVNLWADRGAHVSYLAFRLFPFRIPPVSIPALTPLPDMVERLNALQPWRIGAYASTLALLAAEARAGRLTIAPSLVMNCGEPLLPESRAEVEATFGVRVVDYWGMSEGMYAMSCGHDATMHLPDDVCIVEAVDDDARPVPPGAPAAKILLTNLYNTVTPLIRYEVTDRIVLRPEPCPCGSAYQAVESVQGRSDDVFTYEGGVRVHPLVLRAPLGRNRYVTEYQVRQTRAGAHVLICSSEPVDLVGLARALEDGLRRAGLQAPQVTVERTEVLTRQVSGKLKRFLPLG
jgi:phenylacetate-CoA ligase